MVFEQAFEDYRNNAITAIAFALLLIFVVPFSMLSNVFVSSGTAIIDYGFLKNPVLDILLLLALSVVFLLVYSILVCLMIFAVRADFNKVKMHYYLDEKLLVYSLRYFRFIALFTVLAAVFSSILIDLSVPPLLINFILLLASLPFIFLAQTIVVDGETLRSSIFGTLDFIRKNPSAYLLALGFGFVAVTALQVLEFFIDFYLFGGGYVSLLISLVFLIPFFEALKTEIYMNKFSLFTPYRSAQGLARMGNR